MRKRNICLALISGIVTALAMPSPGWWPLAWVGLAPLFVAMRGSDARSAALYGQVAGAAYFGIVLSWLTIFGYLPWVVAALVASPLYVAFFAVVGSRLMPDRTGGWGYVLVPAAWTAMQWVRSLGAIGFTWGSLAHTQADVGSVIQMASVVGPWGIDFLMCAFNLALAGVVWSSGWRRFVPVGVVGAIALLTVGGGYAAMRSADDSGGAVKVAVVQGNLPQGMDITPQFIVLATRTYGRMTLQAAREGADFVVWPETTLPVRVDRDWDNRLSDLARLAGVNCIVGGYDGPADPGEVRDYNSALFYDRTGAKVGVYHKVQLVPYGEYVPLRKQMPWLENYGIREVDVLPGESHKLVNTEIGRVGVCICFESLFPRIARAEARNGAVALVVMTNDSWFLRSQAARGHMMMAKLRAVENRRYVVRAAATGISTIIDPYGRSTGELGIYKAGLVTGRIKPSGVMTIYTRIGDAFAYGCVLIVVIGLVLSRRRAGKRAAD